MAGGDQVLPRPRRVDAGRRQEVPLIQLPAAGPAARPGVVRQRRLGRRREAQEQQDDESRAAQAGKDTRRA
jgi:hypothetical protein